MGGGGQTSTTVVQPSPMTPEQTALIGKQLELADRQLQAIDAQTPFTNALLQGATELLPLQLDVMKQTLASLNDPQQKALQQAQTQFALDTIPMQREILQQQLDTLKRNGAATPEQAKLIDEQTAAALASGTSDINAARDDALSQLKDFAASSGFGTGDSPILDRGGLVAREAVRQSGKLASDLAGANASAKLNFPLGAAGVQNALAGNAAALTSAAQQFQAQLQAQANANRIQFASGLQSALGGAGAQGLGVATLNAGLPAAIGALNSGRGSTSTTTTSGGGGFNFGSILGGIGGFAQGLGAIGGLSAGPGTVAGMLFGSSRAIKVARGPVDEAAILDALLGLPVERWRYRPDWFMADGAEHIGTFAEDFRDAFGVGDGQTINAVDAIGVLMAAVKALARAVGGAGAGAGGGRCGVIYCAMRSTSRLHSARLPRTWDVMI